MTNEQIYLALISGTLGVLLVKLYDILAALYKRRKRNDIEHQRIDLEASEISFDAAIGIIQELRIELNRLKEQINQLEVQNRNLREIITEMRGGK